MRLFINLNRVNNLERDERQGIISLEEKKLIEAKLSFSTLSIISKIKEEIKNGD